MLLPVTFAQTVPLSVLIAPACTRMAFEANVPGSEIVLPVTVAKSEPLPLRWARSMPATLEYCRIRLPLMRAVEMPAPFETTLIPSPCDDPESTTAAVPMVLPEIVPFRRAADVELTRFAVIADETAPWMLLVESV